MSIYAMPQEKYYALFRALFYSLSDPKHMPSPQEIYEDSPVYLALKETLAAPALDLPYEEAAILFQRGFDHSHNFNFSVKSFNRPNACVATKNLYKTEAKRHFKEARKYFEEYGPSQIKLFFDATAPKVDRMLAYRRWSRSIDVMMSMYEKLPTVDFIHLTEEINRLEQTNRIIRNLAINELSGTLDGSLRSKQALTETMAEVMLHSIKRVNPDMDRKSDDPLLEGCTVAVDPRIVHAANNRSYNCTRVVPATISTAFGGRTRALKAFDDYTLDSEVRRSWHGAFELGYQSGFKDINSLEELFDTLERSPEGTIGVMYNAWKGESFSHVSVAANINGIPCIIEGQTSEVITRNPITGQFESSRITNDILYPPRHVDPNSFIDISFLEVAPASRSSEHQRATTINEMLYSRFMEIEYGVVPEPKPVPIEQRQYHVPAPVVPNDDVSDHNSDQRPPVYDKRQWHVPAPDTPNKKSPRKSFRPGTPLGH